MFEQLGLIGCGLMGGSFALALKRAGLVQRVVGYSKSPSTTDRARQLGVIDVEAPSALLAVAGADIVLLAIPVSAMKPENTAEQDDDTNDAANAGLERVILLAILQKQAAGRGNTGAFSKKGTAQRKTDSLNSRGLELFEQLRALRTQIV